MTKKLESLLEAQEHAEQLCEKLREVLCNAHPVECIVVKALIAKTSWIILQTERLAEAMDAMTGRSLGNG